MPRKRTPAMNALSAIAGSQWAILPEALEAIRDIAARNTRLSPEAIEAIRGQPLDNTRAVTIRDGVATIPVRGSLFRYANIFARISGATSYQDLATDLRTAVDDPSVRAILLAIDSPGGEVNGCAETAGLIRELGARKPIDGYIGGTGASAAYWIASACRRVYAANTAMVGSIGTIWGMEEVTHKDIKVKEYVLVSSQSPKKNIDIRTAEGQADLQIMLDALADVFIDTVAEYRGVTREKVLSDFGQGGMFVGQAAVDAGLVDGISTYEELLAELAVSANTIATLPTFGGRANAQQGEPMKAKQSPAGGQSAPQAAAAPAAPAPAPAATTTEEQEQPAPATEPEATDDDEEEEEAGEAAPGAAALAAARASERERISKIRALAGPTALIEACVNDPDCTPEAAAYRILTAEGSAGASSRLAQLQQDDAGAHASARATNTQSPNVKDAAKASVDQFYQLTQPTRKP